MTLASAAYRGPIERGSSFVIELDAFSGPLDLLLHLIRKDEIDITDIPIARIADQFLAAIEALGLNDAADYLEMAARLLRIKAQMLLPRPLTDDDWEDPRYELVRRLLEYEQVREVVDWLGARSDIWMRRYPRAYLPAPPPKPPAPITLAVDDLVRAVEELLASLPEPVLHRVVARPLDVEGASDRLRDLLERREEIPWAELFGPQPTIVDVLSMLIAVLEFARLRRLRVSQPRPFASLLVTRESPGPTA